MNDTEMKNYLANLGIVIKTNDELVDVAYAKGYTWNEAKQIWEERSGFVK